MVALDLQNSDLQNNDLQNKDLHLETKQSGAAAPGTNPAGFLLSGKATLHHLGFVVSSIARVAPEFASSVSAEWNGDIFHDPTQRVRVAFFYPVDARNPVYELVEPASETSPVSDFLKKRGGLHHTCYEIDDLEAGLREARAAKWIVIANPTPAVAFEGRRIAWICSRQRLLVELLERRHTS